MDAHDVLVKYLHVPEGDAGGWVTFRPSLVRALLHMAKSDEPLSVLELGTGPGSSPMLAELAATGAVRVLAIESNPDYFDLAYSLRSENYTPLASDAPLEKTISVSLRRALNASERFDVVLVDHAPVAARARDLATLAQMNVGLIVVHDWNCDVYGYDTSLFRWRVEDRGRWPNTAILSNTVDLSDWLGYEGVGMPAYERTIKLWDDVGRGAERELAIHPSATRRWWRAHRGRDAAYEASGAHAASAVVMIAAQHTVPPCTKVLDFGCGDGRVLRHLQKAFPTSFGYDTSPAMREAAGRWGDVLTSLEKSDGFFDLAFSFAVFIHHTHADGCAMLHDLARVVRPGGVVAVDIPLYDVAREPSSWTDVGVWTRDQLLDACTRAGLSVEKLLTNGGAFSYDAVGPNHGRLQILRRTK